MKRILLFNLILLIAALSAHSQSQYPCPVDYKGNNGGGNCPNLPLCAGKSNVAPTGTITLNMEFATNVIPTIVSLTDDDPNTTPADLAEICFGPGSLSNNGTAVTYCYYYGGNKINNLFGSNVKYRFVLDYAGTIKDCTVDQIPTPVKIKSFSAARDHGEVDLTWTTSSEQDNKGFEVQKMTASGGWKPVTFISSKAAGGTSTTDLSYTYADANNANGVTQYRLMQIDIDSRVSFSAIRSVQGMMQAGKMIISPNPSNNGIVNVTFESANVKRDVQLSDMNGRLVKQWNNYTDNSLQIQELTPGLYQLRVTNKESGQQNTQKIMVTNR